ncbi:cytidine deaminase-like protein [Backusella circina FSU 941]|nr:cytidine deaminase-like protein [Backusella circina FSU 941]
MRILIKPILYFSLNLLFLVRCIYAQAHCQGLKDQKAEDECFMKIALDYAMEHNPGAPFGAIVVNPSSKTIACYGVNSWRKNALLHGETTAFWNCTELYPSPTNNDMFDPGLDWSRHTLYTTGEPCPMCAAQCSYRGLARVVWGSSIPDLNKSGCPQIMIGMDVVVGATRLGADRLSKNLPVIEGGILKEECDYNFWCGFAHYRTEAYYEAMKKQGLLDYIKEREERFKCPTKPKLINESY